MAKGEKSALEEVAKAIKKDFPRLTDSEIAAMIERAHEDFCNRPIREFVPLFVERRIRARLTEAE